MYDHRVDIVMVTYLRHETTNEALKLLANRTRTPHRVILIDNTPFDPSNVIEYPQADVVVRQIENVGLERARNLGMKYANSEYVVHIDNDIMVPYLEPDWIQQLIRLMEQYPEYAAIALRPQILVGVGPIFHCEPDDMDEVVENNVVGGVGRLMRMEAVKSVGGWDEVSRNEGRGNEEWDICGKLRADGWKVGYARNIWAYHKFIDSNWGYPEGMKFGRVLPEAPKDIAYDPITMVPSIRGNE